MQTGSKPGPAPSGQRRNSIANTFGRFERIAVPAALDDPTRFPYLFAELLGRGYTEADLRKIASGNLLRAMRAMEHIAAELQQREQPSRLRFVPPSR